MTTIIKNLGIDVLEAANRRIKNAFSNGLKVYLSVSGGKDSIVMMSLVYDLIVAGEIDPSLLTVVFVDEEVIYDDVIRVCELWRKRFLLVGAKYEWFTIEHRNNNCFNALENNENFIPWDRYEEENWAHPKPSYAISDSPYLVPRTESYQEFLGRYCADGISLVGVRASESVNRIQYIARINAKGGTSGKNLQYPIADWKDADVWKYIKDRDLDFPDVYLRMWESGIKRDQLRVCNLFSIDTARSLTVMFEVYPELWNKILKREPNAYLVRLYWDSEMFHRSSSRRRKLEDGEEEDTKDYKAMLIDVVNHPRKYFRNPHAINVAGKYRAALIRTIDKMERRHFKKLYEGIMAGDTKTRTLRAVLTTLTTDYAKNQGLEFQPNITTQEE